MIRHLIRQPWNFWKSLSLFFKLEAIALIFIIFAYLFSKLHFLFHHWISASILTPLQLSVGFILLTLLIFLSSTPIILTKMIPQNALLKSFYALPLQPNQLKQLILYIYLKYQTAAISVIFIALTSFAFSSPLFAIAVLAASLTVVYLTFSAYFYFLQKRRAQNTSFQLEYLYNPVKITHQNTQKNGFFIRFLSIFIPLKIAPLFLKEFYGVWRNAAFRRLKYITIIIYAPSLFFVFFTVPANRDMWLTIFSAAVIWLHYTNYFNEKYATPESDWFYKTLPVAFLPLFLAKFLNEVIWMFFIVFINTGLLIFSGLGLAGILNLNGILLVFSFFILFTIIHFQIMFYDNPRFAGYAYHFSVLFFVIMSVQFPLVGPVISLLTLLYYFFKNYKAFHD
jgi:hypothetical protein